MYACISSHRIINTMTSPMKTAIKVVTAKYAMVKRARRPVGAPLF